MFIDCLQRLCAVAGGNDGEPLAFDTRQVDAIFDGIIDPSSKVVAP